MANGGAVIAFGVGICVGGLLVYAIVSQRQQKQPTEHPYHYEIERDDNGRMIGLNYVPFTKQ